MCNTVYDDALARTDQCWTREWSIITLRESIKFYDAINYRPEAIDELIHRRLRANAEEKWKRMTMPHKKWRDNRVIFRCRGSLFLFFFCFEFPRKESKNWLQCQGMAAAAIRRHTQSHINQIKLPWMHRRRRRHRRRHTHQIAPNESSKTFCGCQKPRLIH